MYVAKQKDAHRSPDKLVIIDLCRPGGIFNATISGVSPQRTKKNKKGERALPSVTAQSELLVGVARFCLGSLRADR